MQEYVYDITVYDDEGGTTYRGNQSATANSDNAAMDEIYDRMKRRHGDLVDRIYYSRVR